MSIRRANCSFVTGTNSVAFEKSLILKQNRKELRNCYLWGTINVLLLSILVYDAINACPGYVAYYDYIEYLLISIITINILYYILKILITSLKTEQIPITLEQKKLLGITDVDPNFKIVENQSIIGTPTKQIFSSSFNNSPISTVSTTPMNMTTHSWTSNLSQDSLNYSVSSPSWTFHKGTTPNQSVQLSPNTMLENVSYRDTSGIEFISDDDDLEKYLKDYDTNTNVRNLSNQPQQPTNLLSSFWSHPITKTAKDMSSFLTRSQYQLSSPVSTSLGSPGSKGKTEDKSPCTAENLSSVWTKLNIDIVTLTRWNENLRKWISQTILERLVGEFDCINESLAKQGLSDIKIGAVGLERLRKTAQISHVANFVPSLSTLIPFLEICTNQEYLEKRIRELAKGGCMSEFRWNGGSSYNGKNWDDSLPTDSTIIMHLLGSYLDTQLVPVPSMPDVKPFTGFYFVRYKEKIPNLTPISLYIQQAIDKPPHYRVVVGETVHDMVKGYNNLFHTILFFIYIVNQKEHGMLGRMYLGRAGVNMLWIIDN